VPPGPVGARVYEVPISYFGRTYEEGKKIRPIDGLKSLWQIVKCRIFDRRFTTDAGTTRSPAWRAPGSTTGGPCGPSSGTWGRGCSRPVRASARSGASLLDRERLVLVDRDPRYVARLERAVRRQEQRAGRLRRPHGPWGFDAWQEERLDTVLCSNVLEHVADDAGTLRSFFRTLVPGGHCIVVVPACPRLYTGVDRTLGTSDAIRRATSAGRWRRPDSRSSRRGSSTGSGPWGGRSRDNILRRRHVGPRQVIWFERLIAARQAPRARAPRPGDVARHGGPEARERKRQPMALARASRGRSSLGPSSRGRPRPRRRPPPPSRRPRAARS